MAGHSQFANIKHRKGAQDKKRANLFTKLAREIIVAAKTGLPEPDHNPRLRLAISAARAKSMPKDRIEAAIKKATGNQVGDEFEAIRYEGYASGGVAIIVEALSDNRNRTASDIRSTFTKFGGNLGETGSVSFGFDKVGVFKYPKSVASDEKIFEVAIEAGADDCQSFDNHHEIICSVENFGEVQKLISAKLGDPETGKFEWRAKNEMEVDFETAEKVENLIDKLEDLDDVQEVFSNHTYSEEVAKQLDSKT